jgi:hypothetical protein
MVKTRRKRQKGGGWSWSLNSLGSGWTEFTNSFMSQNNSTNTNIQPGTNNGVINTNANTNTNAIQLMKAGKRKRKHSVKHGGNVIAQAVVPLSLFAMNNVVGSRKRRKRY